MSTDHDTRDVTRPPDGHEFVFYIYEQDADDPRFSFWLERDDQGLSLYERPPDGNGMWLKPEVGSDHDAVAPTEAFERVVAGLMHGGVDGAAVHDLPGHERYFVESILGTIEKDPDALPAPVWGYLNDCADRYAEGDSE